MNKKSSNIKFTLQEVKEYIQEKHPGAQCLTIEYKNNKQKLELQCLYNHQWKMSFSNIKNGHWCPKCSGKAKYTLEEINEFINKHHPGGRCLEAKYLDCKTNMSWCCEKCLYIWSASWGDIKNKGYWCPRCSKKVKPTIEQIKLLIEQREPNSKLLTEAYINNHTKLTIQCGKCNYIWNSNWNRLYGSGHWCPNCAKVAKPNIEDIKNFAQIQCNNGKCLSDKYINNREKLRWQCGKCNYIWEASWHSISTDGTWCPRCRDIFPTMMKKIEAFLNTYHPGSKCLSETYVNNYSKLKFQCNKCKYIWEATWSSIHSGNWCPNCSKHLKYTIEDIISFVDRNHPGGKCLSLEYKNAHSKLEFQCGKCTYIWATSWHSINIHKTWCPKCRDNISEKIIRNAFSKIFGKEFIKIKPEWLERISGNKNTRLEIDCYCEELKIGVEHQGDQHYRIVEIFNMTKEDLIKRKEYDEFKRQKCKERGIKLLEIKQLDTRKITSDKLKEIIKQKCIEHNINLPNNFDEIELDFSDI